MSSDCACDNRYFNIKIINTDFVHAQKECRYQANLTVPIIDNPKEYYISLIKFSIPGGTIPVWYAQTDLTFPNVNINQLVNTVSMRNPATNISFTQHVIYVPSSTFPPPPFDPLPTPTSPGFVPRHTYFFLYTYNQVLNLFNTALAACLAGLKIADPTIPAATEPPYFIYTAGSQIISLIVPITWINEGQAPLIPFPLELYFNRPSYELFNAFEQFFDSDDVNLTFQLILDYKDNYYQPPYTVPTAPNLANYIKIDEEYQIYRNWYPLRNIIFVSNSLKTVGEATPNFEHLLTGSITDNLTGNVSFESILTEFTPDLNEAGAVRDQLIFTQTGPLRLIDLTSTVPINQVDIFIYWSDIYGHRFPVLIPYNGLAEVKLLFIKKDIYKQSLIVGKK